MSVPIFGVILNKTYLLIEPTQTSNTYKFTRYQLTPENPYLTKPRAKELLNTDKLGFFKNDKGQLVIYSKFAENGWLANLFFSKNAIRGNIIVCEMEVYNGSLKQPQVN